MKKVITKVLSVVLMLMVSMVISAQDEAPKVKVDINEFTGGKVEVKGQGAPSETDGSVVVTITVTPTEGYYITRKDILVVPTMPVETTRDATPSFADPLALSGDDPADKTQPRDYTFTVPSGLGAWVKEAVFHSTDELYNISGDEKSEVIWKYDSESTTLTLTGSGTTKDFGKEGEIDPLEAYRTVITSIVIEKDITSLGANIFKGCTALTSITIQNSEQLVTLSEDAIPANDGLKINVPANLLNEYQITDGWKSLTIGSEDAVEMSGISFGANNDYDTFVSKETIMVPSVLTAYLITGISNEKLELTKVSVISAGVPVLLFNEKGLTETSFYSAATNDGDSKGTSGLLKVAPVGGVEVKLGEVFILYNDVFYYTQAGTIPEGRVYLTNPAPSKSRASYPLGTRGTTDIDGLYIDKVEKQQVWYGLDGRVYNSVPTRKGIYIKDGKKIIIK